MGEAKNKGSYADRVTGAQTQADIMINTAYDTLFPVIEAEFEDDGGVANRLLGLAYTDGKITEVAGIILDSEAALSRAPQTIQRMLQDFPVVLHVFDAWCSPPHGSASNHPERKDIIAFMFHTNTGAWAGNCFSNPTERTVEKVDLLKIDKLGGRLGRPFQTLQ